MAMLVAVPQIGERKQNGAICAAERSERFRHQVSTDEQDLSCHVAPP